MSAKTYAQIKALFDSGQNIFRRESVAVLLRHIEERAATKTGNLQVFRFDYREAEYEVYTCSHPGDQSGDYVSLAQAEALRVSLQQSETLLQEALYLFDGEHELCDEVPSPEWVWKHKVREYFFPRQGNARYDALQSPATSRDDHNAD